MINSALSGGMLLISAFAYGQIDSNNLIAANDDPQNEIVVVAEAPTNKSTKVALGEDANATGEYSVAIGSGSSASLDNTMVLGGDSYDDRVSVGIGTSHPNSLASLELADQDKGLLVNRLSKEQADIFAIALGMNDEGMLIYNTSVSSLQTWNGIEWLNVSAKNLELKNHQLTLNGSTVDLSDYQQDLTAATLNGKALTIEIENGQNVTVDLTPMFQEYEDRLAALEARSDKSENEVTPSQNESSTDGSINEAKLNQNAPNPFQGSSKVTYFLPEGTTSAYLVLLNTSGKIMLNEKLLAGSGEGQKTIFANNFTPGVYYLSLYVDRKKVDSISMVVR